MSSLKTALFRKDIVLVVKMPARKRQPSKRKAEAPVKEVIDKKKEKRGENEPAIHDR